MAEELKVILKAKELAEHTLRVTSNCNRYPKRILRKVWCMEESRTAWKLYKTVPQHGFVCGRVDEAITAAG